MIIYELGGLISQCCDCIQVHGGPQYGVYYNQYYGNLKTLYLLFFKVWVIRSWLGDQVAWHKYIQLYSPFPWTMVPGPKCLGEC